MPYHSNVLVVDDQPDNRLILQYLLAERHTVLLAATGQEALNILNTHQVDLILLDVVMPGLDGFEVCRRIKSSALWQEIPILFITSLESAADEERGLSLGAEDFIHKPFSPAVVLARVCNHLKLAGTQRELRRYNQELALLVEMRTREAIRKSEELVLREQQVIAAQSATIAAFCALAEARDTETGNHIRRTQHYVKVLAERLSTHPRFSGDLSEETILLLFKSAPLHDVGKVAIPDHILLKRGKLTEEEWSIMQKHTVYGRDAILQAESEFKDGNQSFLCCAREIAYSHHERWDGTGYPQGLKGEAIPASARLMAIADVYDALISRRVYKPAFTHEQAVAIIAAGRSGQFDPDVADAFLDIADEFRAIADHFSDAF